MIDTLAIYSDLKDSFGDEAAQKMATVIGQIYSELLAVSFCLLSSGSKHDLYFNYPVRLKLTKKILMHPKKWRVCVGMDGRFLSESVAG